MHDETAGGMTPCGTAALRGFVASTCGNEHNKCRTSAANTPLNAAKCRADKDAIPAFLATLVPLRHTVNADIAGLMEASSFGRFADRRQLALRHYNQRYTPALAQLSAFPAAVLAGWRDDLVARLGRGWGLEGEHVTETIMRVVAELEVMEDATAGVEAARRAHVERMERVQAIQWPK